MKFTFAGIFDVAYFSIGFADTCCSIAVAYLNYQYFYGQHDEGNNDEITFFHKLLIFSGPGLSLLASLASTYSLDSYLTYSGQYISAKLRLQGRTFLAGFVDFYDVYGKNNNNINNDKDVLNKRNKQENRLQPEGTAVTIIKYVSWYVVAMSVSPIAPIVNYLLTYLACYERKNPTDPYETIVGQKEFIWATERGNGDCFHGQDAKVDWKMKMLDTKRRRPGRNAASSKSPSDGRKKSFFPAFLSHSIMSLFSERIYCEYEDGTDFIEHQLDIATTHEFLYASQIWEMVLRSIPNLLIQGLLFAFYSEVDTKEKHSNDSNSSSSFFTNIHLVSCLLSITQISLFFSARVFRATNFVGEFLPNWSFLAFDGVSTCICVIGILSEQQQPRQGGSLLLSSSSSFSFGAKVFLVGKSVALAADFVTYSIYGLLLAANTLFDGRFPNRRVDAAVSVASGAFMWIVGLLPLVLARNVMKLFSVLAIAKDQVLHDQIPATTIGSDYLAFHRLFHTFLFSKQTPCAIQQSVSANKKCDGQVEVDWHSTFKNARLVLLSMAIIPANHGECQNRVSKISSMTLFDLVEKCAVYRIRVQLGGNKNNNVSNDLDLEPERRAYHFAMMTRLFLWLEQVQDVILSCRGEEEIDDEQETNITPSSRLQIIRNAKEKNDFQSIQKAKSQLSKIQALITSATDEKPFSSATDLSQEFSRESAEINNKLIFNSNHSLGDQSAFEKIKMMYRGVLSSLFGASQDSSPVSISNCKRFVAPALLIPTVISTATEIWYLGSLFCEKYNPSNHQTEDSHHFDRALQWFLLPAVGFCFTTSLLLLPRFLRHFWSNVVECTFFNRLFQRRNSIEDEDIANANPKNGAKTPAIPSSRKPWHGSTLFKHEILVDAMDSYCQIPAMIQVRGICVKKDIDDGETFQKIPEQAVEEHLMPFLHRKFFVDGSDDD